MAIKQTFNRDLKTKGGMKGLTIKKGDVNRWLLMKECKLMTGKDQQGRARKDLDKTRIARVEQD